MSLVEKTHNGLPVVTLHHPSGASAMIFVYAAHLASWTTSDGEQQLFLSSAADYAHGKAIRGGVPVCWPQFAERGAYGKHGFARTSSKWRIVRTSTEPHPCVVLGLSSDEETLASFPFPFELRYSVTLDGPSSVSVSLTVINTGADTLEFTTALHTYFSVDDPPHLVELPRLPQEEELRIVGEENGKALRILKMGFPDAVVWNIGQERAGGLKDLGAGLLITG
ncbi:MAG: hypothetical protein SGPRY_012358 [Prymnesium sp.]